ncbi:MAG TPA: type II CAAX endopeptidase family protein [Candidatus Cybelea sp.]|nr:type II CAAX endopeptidase family protein [Candidatus Cybelea sp.]
MNDSTSATSPAWPTRWPKDSFKGVWTWLLAAFFALLCLAAAVLQLEQGPVAPMSPLLFDLGIALQFVVEAFFAAIILAALPALSKFSLRQLGFRAPTLATIGIGVVGFVAMFVVADGSASLIEYFAHSRHQQDIVQIFKMLHDPTSIGIFIVFAVIFAPFAEETFFRIFFFNLGLRYGGFWGGAVLSGVMFGIVHGDVIAAVPLALGGMVLCAVYYITRNAYASMISHALFNGLSIATLLFAPKIT